MIDTAKCPDCCKDWGHSYCGTCYGREFVPIPIKWEEGDTALIEVKLTRFSSDDGWVWVSSPNANGWMCVPLNKLQKP
jgi:hypothetical protein